jgi:hypothetical protein
MSEVDSERKEVVFNPQSLAVVSTVHYPNWYEGEVKWENTESLSDKVRGDLALEMVSEAKSRNYQVAIVDSGASPAFSQKLGGFEILTFQEEKGGMSTGRQQGFREASLLKYTDHTKQKFVEAICWLEPEKISIISDCLPKAIEPILLGQADVVIPKRSNNEFEETYPDYQVKYERDGNRLWNGMLRKFGILGHDQEDLDVWFGPRMFRNTPEITQIFLTKYKYEKSQDTSKSFQNAYKPSRYSNATFFPVIVALFEKLRVISVEVPYRHPSNQTKIEKDSDGFRKKRADQQREIIRTCSDFCRMLIGTRATLNLQLDL